MFLVCAAHTADAHCLLCPCMTPGQLTHVMQATQEKSEQHFCSEAPIMYLRHHCGNADDIQLTMTLNSGIWRQLK